MIEPTKGVPAHIALLLNEQFDWGDPVRVVRTLKGMVRELKRQAEVASFDTAADLQSGPTEFKAVLSGGLDLFSGYGACQQVICRMGYAAQTARSIILMADQVTVHDFFQERILGLRDRPTNDELFPLVADLHVLQILSPVIEEGLFRFISPFMPACKHCISAFDDKVEALTNQLLESREGEISVEKDEQYFAIDTQDAYDPPLVIRFDPEFGKKKSGKDLLAIVLRMAVRTALWDARDASLMSGTMFSNSAVGVSALLAEDGRSLTRPEFRVFAGQRAADLPWVAGLTVQQTIDLRNEASSALPNFREFLARRLGAKEDQDAASWDECVAELREQAQEVRSELELVTRKSASLRRNANGILGLTVSAACFAAEGPSAALGGLLGTLGLLHSMPTSEPHPAQVLKAKPGFLLVAAQDILGHARESAIPQARTKKARP